MGIPEHFAVAAIMPLGRPVKVLTKLERKPVSEFTMLERLPLGSGELSLLLKAERITPIRRPALT